MYQGSALGSIIFLLKYIVFEVADGAVNLANFADDTKTNL